MEEVRKFIQAVSEDEPQLEQFDQFAPKLMKALEKCFFGGSKSVKREKNLECFPPIKNR